MKILSIYDEEFREYGRVLDGDFSSVIEVLKTKECPDNSTCYVPSDNDLENCPEHEYFRIECYGGLPVQIGYCNGHNRKLNCLEYHKDSEINVAVGDLILLLGRLQDVKDNKYDTSLVKAFLVPSGKAVEVYSTSLHYAPCGVNGSGFRCLVVLPKGTNLDRPEGALDPLLWASNKWLLAHKDTNEARQGAYIGLVGENIEI